MLPYWSRRARQPGGTTQVESASSTSSGPRRSPRAGRPGCRPRPRSGRRRGRSRRAAFPRRRGGPDRRDRVVQLRRRRARCGRPRGSRRRRRDPRASRGRRCGRAPRRNRSTRRLTSTGPRGTATGARTPGPAYRTSAKRLTVTAEPSVPARYVVVSPSISANAASSADAVISSPRSISVRTTSCSVSEKRSPRALKTPGEGGMSTLAIAERAGDLDPRQRPVAAEGAEGEVAWIAAAIGGDRLHGAGHRGDSKHQDAVGGLLDGAAERSSRRRGRARRASGPGRA